VRAPLLVLAGCLLAAVVVVLATVPLDVLPGADLAADPARDFTAAEIAREQAFHSAVRPWAYAGLVLSLVVLALLALSGWAGRLVSAIPGHWTLRAGLAVLGVLLVTRLATLPADVGAERVLRDYGLSTHSWATWFDDQLRGLAVGVGLTLLAALPLLWLARRLPGSWWLPGAALAGVLVVGGSFAYPLVVEPVFNTFRPMAEGPLRTELLALADRDGVDVDDVLVADASRRTTALNAYVSGIGSTRRIVVYDTLLKKATDREVELVVAHELGHVKRRDVVVGTAVGAFGGAAGMCALFVLLSWQPLLRRVGASSAGDPAVLPLVALLAAVTPLLLAPLTNVVSRHVEARADVHALDLTGDVDAAVATERRLATSNLSDLDPNLAIYAFFFTHPSAPQRIALAREWERLRR